MTESLHDQAMAKFEKAIALIKEAAYLEYRAAQLIENKPENEPSYSFTWVSAASMNQLANCHERVFECAIKALRGKPTKHLKGQLTEILIRTVDSVTLTKITTDILDSSNDHVQLIISGHDVDPAQFGTDRGVEILYEDFNRDYWFNDAELRPRLITVLEKHGMKEGVNFLIPNESVSVIKVVSAYTNVLDELKRFIALLEDLAQETNKP